jgi:hypothetical protein
VWVAAVATVVTCALTAFMPVWILAAQGGTDQISEAAPIDTVSPWLLAGCLTAMAVIIALAVKSNHALPPWAPDWVLQVLACLATCAVMIIATSSSWADMLYYPRKMEWFAMALSLPALVALVGLGVGTLLAAADVRGRHTLAVTAVTLVVVVVGVAALAAVLKPAAVRSNLSAVRRVASPAPPRWWDVAVRPELLTVLNSGGTAIAWRFGNHSATAQTNRVISVWPQSQTPIEALMGAMPGSSPVMCRYLEDHRATVVLFTSGPRLAAAAAQGGCTPTTNAAVPRAMKSPVRR